jgi:hypothetical protein
MRRSLEIPESFGADPWLLHNQVGGSGKKRKKSVTFTWSLR